MTLTSPYNDNVLSQHPGHTLLSHPRKNRTICWYISAVLPHPVSPSPTAFPLIFTYTPDACHTPSPQEPHPLPVPFIPLTTTAPTLLHHPTKTTLFAGTFSRNTMPYYPIPTKGTPFTSTLRPSDHTLLHNPQLLHP